MNRRGDASRENGSILPLIAVFTALCLALVLVVLAAGSLSVERKRLFTLADGAALAGAEAIPLDRAPDSPGELPALRDADVRAAAVSYLAGSLPGAPDGTRLVRALSPDGRSASVTVAADWHPPVLGFVLPDGVRIEVTSSARSGIG